MKAKVYISVVFLVFGTILFSCTKENMSPVCAFMSPESGTGFLIGSDITLYAEFNDPDGEIKQLDLYINDVHVVSTVNEKAIYSWKTNTEEPGLYTILCIATDNNYAKTTKSIEITLVNQQTTMGGPCPGIPTITDIDGNIYNTVLIGTQCWMKENLKVTHYPNGDEVPQVILDDQWASLADNNTDDAMCLPLNDDGFHPGALYTYAAATGDNWERDVNEGQGICPYGWHLPTDYEWRILEGTLDAVFSEDDPEWKRLGWRGMDAGKKLKAASKWDYNGSGTNCSGFSALPSGFRSHESGEINDSGIKSIWWTATERSPQFSYDRGLDCYIDKVQFNNYYKSSGYSVRCIKD